MRRGLKPIGFWFKRILKSIWAWSTRKRDDLILDGLIALVILGVAFVLDGRIANRQEQLSLELAIASEVQENTRFVRQVALIDGAVVRPFSGLNLRGASLGGLDLSCDGFPLPETAAEAKRVPETKRNDGYGHLEGCTDLWDADLTSADLGITNLSGAYLLGASVTGADLLGAVLWRADLRYVDLRQADLRYAALWEADLTDADLTDADLREAQLNDADLTGADLTGADLTDADLEGTEFVRVCYDDATSWPEAYTPPSPPVCD